MLYQLLVVTTAFIALFGSTATYIGLRAFKRSKDGCLLFAAAGFTLITVGMVLGGLVYVFFARNMMELYLAQSAMVAAGLLSIVCSISLEGRLKKPR